MIHGIDLGSYVVPVIRSEVVLATGIGLCQLAGKRFGKRANIARCEKIVGRETGEAVGGAKEVADKCGNVEEARVLFGEYGSRLASFAAPLISRFGAEMLVLGGNISRAYAHFGDALEKGLSEAGVGVPVKVSSLMDKAALVGAAQLFAK